MYFQYGEEEIAYLKAKDKALAEVIDTVGYVKREADPDLFSSVVHHIVGQQISTKAQATIWARIRDGFDNLDAESIVATDTTTLQSHGISFRKVEYIQDFAHKVLRGEFDLDTVAHMSDDEAIAALSSLKGIGTWTAEMLLIFCLQRPNILSFGDLAIQRGLRMLYHHRRITPQLFAKYKRRFSPYGSVASLYLWEVSGGAIPGMKDYAPKNPSKSSKRK